MVLVHSVSLSLYLLELLKLEYQCILNCVSNNFFYVRLQYIQPLFGCVFYLLLVLVIFILLCGPLSLPSHLLSHSLHRSFLCISVVLFPLSLPVPRPPPRASFHSVAFISAICFVLFIYSVFDIPFFLLPIMPFCSLTFHMILFFFLNRISNQSQFGRLNRMILHFNFFFFFIFRSNALLLRIELMVKKRLAKSSSGKMYVFFFSSLLFFYSTSIPIINRNESNTIINI